jgi:signal transduction histidine kinase
MVTTVESLLAGLRRRLVRSPRGRASGGSTVFASAIVAPTLLGLGYLISKDPGVIEPELIIWVVLIAAAELLPVPTWHGVNVSLGFPMLIAVAFVYDPAAAGAVAFLGSFDPREFRRKVSLSRALFNRAQVTVAVTAASATFHAFGSLAEPWPRLVPVALLATFVDYAVNLGLVSIYVALNHHLKLSLVARQLLGRGHEFLISYLGLGLVGTVLAKLFLVPGVGMWSVVTVVAPLLFARQMFFRTQALEEAHRELQDREQVLRTLSNRMAEERQDERAAIAAYLHDDLAQLLFRLSIQVDVARRHLAAGKLEDATRVLDQIKDTKQQTSDRIRALIRDLHRSPLGPAGLAEAIQSFIAEVGRDSELRFHTDISEVPLPAPIALLLYHIAREGVMNTLKHADASNVWVTVQQTPEAVELVLRDDGKGFDPEAPTPEGHFGLAMMRERALVGGGTYEIRSAPGEGTTVTVRFPTALLREAEGSEPGPRSPRGSVPGGEAGASPGTPRTGPTQERSQQRVRA